MQAGRRTKTVHRTKPPAGPTPDTAAARLERVTALLPEFARRAAAHDQDDAYVEENIAALQEAEFFTALVPARFGGGGVSHPQMVRAIRDLARACPATALVVSMHQHLVATNVWNALHGRPGEALLRRVVEARPLLVSTGAGDWLASSGTLTAVEGGFHLTARKGFASGCLSGDLLVTSARLDDEVLHFALPLTADGVRLERDWRTLGMRGTGSHSVVIENAFVPEAAISLRRPAGAWHPVWSVIATVALPLIMAAYVGVADEATRLAVEGVRGKPANDALALDVGELLLAQTTADTALKALTDNAADFDFEPTLEQADRAFRHKNLVARAVRACLDAAFAVAGGRAFYRASALERLLRDSYGAGLHLLPDTKQRLFSGRLALGLDPVGTG